MLIYIKRAYWAVSNIHNKVFFNQASRTYATPDREDEIVAMLIEQDPVEVALLCITREIVRKAEEELPEKRVNISKQNENKIIVEPAIRQMQNKKEEQEHQAAKTNLSYEELYNTIQDDKSEIDELNKIKLQDSTESLHNKVSIQVGQVSNMQIEESMPIQEKNIEEQKNEQDQVDAEMSKREPEYNEIVEGAREQSGKRQEVEKEIDIVRTPLEESI